MSTLRHRDDICEVWQGDAREVASSMADGSCSLAIVDGPYSCGKADWDRQGIDGLVDWYRPHLEDVGRVCGASASLYVWNTAEGWARLDPLIRSMGWTFSTLIVWCKVGANPARLSAARAGKWPDVTEVCGHYTRGGATHQNPAKADNTWLFDPTNGMRNGERLLSGGTVVRPGGSGRKYECAEALHPCQKPVLFARRMIEASTRPGERVWVPFGGTLRECIAARDIAMGEPSAARSVVTAELDMDGRDYITAALRQYHRQGTRPVDPRQGSLFATVKQS